MSCETVHPYAARLEANAKCEHSVDTDVDPEVVASEGHCPTCKTPLHSCDHRYCPCCGWVWPASTVTSFAAVLKNIGDLS